MIPVYWKSGPSTFFLRYGKRRECRPGVMASKFSKELGFPANTNLINMQYMYDWVLHLENFAV